MGVNHGQRKQTTNAVWSLGDYRPIARLLEPAAYELVQACRIGAGQDMLDVAAGNGNCALAAARRGARVVASDLTPALVQLGRARTQAAGLAIGWVEAAAEALPFAAGRFDCDLGVRGRCSPRGPRWWPPSCSASSGPAASWAWLTGRPQASGSSWSRWRPGTHRHLLASCQARLDGGKNRPSGACQLGILDPA
jgi:SAM-dependent methyltransferase